MTKVMCGKLDCEFLGDSYICQKQEIMLGCFLQDVPVDYINCTSYKPDRRWETLVKTLQEQVDKGENVI